MLSPLSKILPIAFLLFLLTETSAASSNTRFMYSSNPTIFPSILRSVFSYSQTNTLSPLCKNRKMRLMGWVMILCWCACKSKRQFSCLTFHRLHLQLLPLVAMHSYLLVLIPLLVTPCCRLLLLFSFRMVQICVLFLTSSRVCDGNAREPSSCQRPSKTTRSLLDSVGFRSPHPGFFTTGGPRTTSNGTSCWKCAGEGNTSDIDLEE